LRCCPFSCRGALMTYTSKYHIHIRWFSTDLSAGV
jgi:hypothetical protein